MMLINKEINLKHLKTYLKYKIKLKEKIISQP
jgi:hypothetical protein